jgi:ubiquinone/menaquinone biosynthesis C-methylase UbiE
MSDSSAYFAQVANEWDELRSGYFTAEMRDAAIARAQLPPGAVVADVGAGTGFVIDGLLPVASRIVGFDASPEMLAVARQKFADVEQVTFREAEGAALPAADDSFDAVFANMYLHHAPEPEAAIREMARLLRPGGKLVITDLDSHDQYWMQQAMADRWLGFDREVVGRWYAAAGLGSLDIDCAAGSCDCTGPAGEGVSLSVFVALGRKPAS